MILFFIIYNVFCFCFLAISFLYRKTILSFDENQCIIYKNGIKIITVKNGSANYRFLVYIFNNTNKEITIKELEENVFYGGIISLKKAVYNTPFNKDIILKHFSFYNGYLIFSDQI